MADLFEEKTPAAQPAEADVILSLPEEAEGKAAPDTGKGKTKKKKPLTPAVVFSNFFDIIETFCYALVLMMVVFVFVLRIVTVDGTSMENTLKHQDRLIISDLFFTPSTGDIVVLDAEGVDGLSQKYIIKRVIAVGGQRVELDYDDWRVTVDGVVLNESYIKRSGGLMNRGSFDEDPNVVLDAEGNHSFVVPEGTVFVMGDNRNGSTDGRMVGFLEEERILGRVLLRLFPWDTLGRVK